VSAIADRRSREQDRQVFRTRTLSTALVAAIASALAWVLLIAPGGPLPGPARTVRIPARLGLASLPAAAQAPVSAALGLDSPAYRPRQVSGGELDVANPVQHLQAAFSDAGVQVSAGAARIGLSLRGYGAGSALRAVAPLAPELAGGRVVYRHPGLSESWANGPLGLEQSFELGARPPSAGARPLTLALALTGNVTAHLAGGVLVLGHANRVLRYAGLRATDASGRQLSSWMQLSGRTVLLRVDARDARFPVRIDPFIQEAVLSESSAEAQGYFGSAIAISGNTAVIGAPYYGTGGEAFIFTEGTDGWSDATQAATLDCRSSAGDAFGSSVAISGDDVIVGAPDAGTNDAGTACEFEKPVGGWSGTVFEDGITNMPPGPKMLPKNIHDNLGESVAIGGGAAFVGIPGQGWVGIYPAVGASSDTSVLESGYGDAIAISGDGRTLAVTDNVGAGSNPLQVGEGAVDVYAEPADSSDPSQLSWLNSTAPEDPATLQPTSLTTGAQAFGTSIAFRSDGSTLFVGAPGAAPATASTTTSGVVYVFARGGSAWTNQIASSEDSTTETLSPDSPADGEQFGASVATDDNGDTVIVGAPGASSDAGEAYTFDEPPGGWSTTASLMANDIADPGTAAANDGFGTAVAMSDDGTAALAGDPYQQGSATLTGEGFVYDFERATPINTSAPTLTGLAEPGNQLICDTGMWKNSPTSYTFTWQRDETTVQGPGPDNVYNLTAADLGTTITCIVTATNSEGSASATSAGDVITSTGPTGPTGTPPPASFRFTISPDTDPLLSRQTITFSVVDPVPYVDYVWDFGDQDQTPGSASSPFNGQKAGPSVTWTYADPPIVQPGASTEFPCPPAFPGAASDRGGARADARAHASSCAAPTTRDAVYVVRVEEVETGYPSVMATPQNVVVVPVKPPNASFMMLRSDAGAGSGSSTDVTQPVTIVPQGALASTETSAQDSIVREDFWLNGSGPPAPPDITCLNNGTCGHYGGTSLIPSAGSLIPEPWLTNLNTGALRSNGSPVSSTFRCARNCPADFRPTAGFESFAVNFWDRALAQIGTSAEPQVPTAPATGFTRTTVGYPPLTSVNLSQTDGNLGEQGMVPNGNCLAAMKSDPLPCGILPGTVGADGVFPAQVPGDREAKSPNPLYLAEDQFNFLYNYATVVGPDTPLDDQLGPATGASQILRTAPATRKITMVAYDAEGDPSTAVTEPVTLTPTTNPTIHACIADVTSGSACVDTSKFTGKITPFQIVAGDTLQLDVDGSTGGDDPLLYYAAEVGRPNTDPIGNLVPGGKIDPSKPNNALVAPCQGPAAQARDGGGRARSGGLAADTRGHAVIAGSNVPPVPTFGDLEGGAGSPFHPCEGYAERTVNANGQPDPLPPSGPVHVAIKRHGRQADSSADQAVVTSNPNSVLVRIPATNPQPWPTGGDSGGVFSLALAEYNTAGLGAITRTDGILALKPGPSGFCQQVTSWPWTLPGGQQEVGFSGACMTTDGSHWFVTSSTMDIDGMPLAPQKGDFLVIAPAAKQNQFYVTDSCTIKQSELTDTTVPGDCAPHGNGKLFLALGTSADGPGMAYETSVTGATAAALFSPASTPSGTAAQGCGMWPGSQPWTLASHPQYDQFDVKTAPCIAFTQAPTFESRADFYDSLPDSFAPVNASGSPTAPPTTTHVHLSGVDQPPVTNLTTTPYGTVARARKAKRVLAGSGVRLDDDSGSFTSTGIPDPPSCPADDNSKLSIPPDTNLGPWSLPGNAELCYDSSTGDFIGDATISIPAPIPIQNIKIGFEIGQGRLIEAGGDVTGALPIGPMLLTELKFDLKTDPVIVAAEIQATIAPLIGLDMSGTFDGDQCSATGPSPPCTPTTATPSFDLNGAVSLAGFNFANFNIHFGPNIWTMSTSISASFGPASINITVNGGIYTGTPFQFYLEGNGSACLFVCLGVDGLISNEALAGCGSINLVVATVSAGFAVVWSGPNSGVQLFTGCDLTPYIPAVFKGGAVDPQPVPKGGLWAAHAGDTGPPLALAAGQSAGLQLCPSGSPPGCATDVVAVQVHSLLSQENVGESPQVTLSGPDGRTITTPCTPGYYGFVGDAAPSGCLQSDSQTDEGTAMVDENPVPVVDEVPGSAGDCPGVGASTTFATLPSNCPKVTTTTLFIADPGTGSWTLSVPAGAPNVVDTTVATTDGPTTPSAFDASVTKPNLKATGDGFVADIDHHEYPSSMLNAPYAMMLAPSADVPVASASRTKRKKPKPKRKPPTLDVPVIDQSRLRAILLKVPVGFEGKATVIDTSSAGQQVLANNIDAAEIPKGGLPIVFEPDVASGRQQIQAFLSNADGFPSGVITLSSFTPPAPPVPQAPKIVKIVRKGATVHIYFKPGNAPIANGVSLTLSVGDGQQLDETFAPAQLKPIGKETGIGAAKQAPEYEATVTGVEPTEPVSLALHGSNDGRAGKTGRARRIKPAVKSIGAKELLKRELRKHRHKGHGKPKRRHKHK
jgi:hypothetical protein